MVAGTLAYLGSLAVASTPYLTVASTAYGLGSAYEADKQAGERRAEEKKQIAEANEKSLTKRKSLIDKQRLQLMGAGDGKYTTNRATGVNNPLAPKQQELLG